MPVRAVVLDMDDTLYDEHDYVISGFTAVADHLDVPEFSTVALEVFDSGERRQVFDRSLELLGINPDGDLVLELRDVYRAHHPRISLSADAEWLLSSLSPDCPIALISDGYLDAQRKKFDALGVAHRFAVVLFTDALGRAHWKPSEVPFRMVSRALDVPAEDCVYIGDNPTKDFLAPRALGWATVRVTRPRGVHRELVAPAEQDAEHRVESLHGLADLGLLTELWQPAAAISTS